MYWIDASGQLLYTYHQGMQLPPIPLAHLNELATQGAPARRRRGLLARWRQQGRGPGDGEAGAAWRRRLAQEEALTINSLDCDGQRVVLAVADGCVGLGLGCGACRRRWEGCQGEPRAVRQHLLPPRSGPAACGLRPAADGPCL